MVTDDYDTISSFLSDIQLLVSNTRLVYRPGSEEHKQVDALEASFSKVLIQHGIGVVDAPRRSSTTSVSPKSSASPTDFTLRIPKAHIQLTPPTTASGTQKTMATTSGEPGASKGASRESKGLSKAESKGLSKLESKGLSKSESAGLSKSSESKGLSKAESKKAESKGLSKAAAADKPATSQGKGSSKQTAGAAPGGGRGRVARKMEEYAASEDPVKMFLAAVCGYHDPASGDSVAEPFMQLPSRTLYPEYYKVITQPIDINTIIKNTEVRARERERERERSSPSPSSSPSPRLASI